MAGTVGPPVSAIPDQAASPGEAATVNGDIPSQRPEFLAIALGLLFLLTAAAWFAYARQPGVGRYLLVLSSFALALA